LRNLTLKVDERLVDTLVDHALGKVTAPASNVDDADDDSDDSSDETSDETAEAVAEG